MPVRTDDELVAEVLKERAIERGEIVEEDECDQEEPEMTIKEILSSVTKLRRALLSRGDVYVHAANMLALVQDKVGREGIRNA